MTFLHKLKSKKQMITFSVFFTILLTALCAEYGDPPEYIAAATSTYDCPYHGEMVLESNSGTSTCSAIFGSTALFSTSIYTTYKSVFKDDFFGCGIPSTGDIIPLDRLQGQNCTQILSTLYTVKCPLCERKASVNNSTGKISFGASGTISFIEESTVSGYYIILTKYVKNTGYKVVACMPVEDYIKDNKVECTNVSSRYVRTTSTAEQTAHTYNVHHTCSDKCRERLHAHESKWSDTEYEYSCDCTTVNYVSWSGTISSSESPCGHSASILNKEYYCTRCGRFLGESVRKGCSHSSCWNYYKDLHEYTEFTHPGTHTYKAKGIRKLCTCTDMVKDGYKNSDGDYYYNAVCTKCGVSMYEYTKGVGYAHEYACSISTSASPKEHYYYVMETSPESCYAYDYDNIHYASRFISLEEKDTWHCGHGAINCVTTTYSCSICGASIYVKNTETGCASCGLPAVNETYECFDSKNSYLIGELSCFFYDDKTGKSDQFLNKQALHMPKTLVCAEAEYGDNICDKTVTRLIPIENSQIVTAKERVNTKAYARFYDGHIEIVDCTLSALDANLLNTWQTATISYKAYPAADKQNLKTAEIQVYIECVEFNLTLISDDTEGGTLSGARTYSQNAEATAEAVANIGYIFDGWYDGDTKVSSDATYMFRMPAKHLTLTAKFRANTYTLTTVSESDVKGSVTGGGSVTYKAPTTVKAVPKTSFLFQGWYQDAIKVSSDAEYTFTMPAKDVSLVAKFLGKEITVFFNANKGSACSPIKANYLSGYGDLPVPTRSGYTFLGWTYNNDYVTESSPVPVDVDHTLTAAWAEAGPEFLLIQFGDAYKMNSYGKLPVPVKRGYDFLSWFKTENLRGNGDSLGVSGNIILPDTIMETTEAHTIHAGWIEKTFTLKFDSNGGSDCSNMIITYDRMYGYSKPLPIPTKPGYTFTGWYVSNVGGNGDGTQITNTSRVQALSDQTLYAGWTQDAIEITVHFVARTKEQAGLTTEESRMLGYGSTIGTLTGAADRTVTYPGTYGNYNLTWCSCTDAMHETLPKYGGRHYIVDYTSPYNTLPIPERMGYTFTGWRYEDVVVTEKTNTLATYEHTVFATYKALTYDIVFDARGGRFDYGGSKLLADMTAHEFAAIYYDNTSNYPKTLTYAITFDDRITDAVRSLKNGTTTTDVAIPVKTGYKFGGYYTDIKGHGIKIYDANGQYCYSPDDAYNYIESAGGFKWADISTLYAYWIPSEDDADITSNPYYYPHMEYSTDPEELEAVSGMVGVDMEFDVQDSEGNYNIHEYIPSTESLSLTGSVANLMLLYQFEADEDRTPSTFVYNVTVPCTIQCEDSVTEELVITKKTTTKTVEVPSYATQYTLSKFALFKLHDLRIGSESVLDDVKYALTNAPDISCGQATDTTAVVDGRNVYTYTCGNITIRIYDDHSNAAGYEENIHATSLYNAKSEYNKGYFIATATNGRPQKGNELNSDNWTFGELTYDDLVTIIANNTGVYIGGNTKSDSITIQTSGGEVVIGGTDAVTSIECLAQANVTVSGNQAVFPLNTRALNNAYELEYVADYTLITDIGIFDANVDNSAAKNIYKARCELMKKEALKERQLTYRNATTSNNVTYVMAEDFSAITATLRDGDTIKVHIPVASNSKDFSVDLAGLYAEFTIIPDNTYLGTGYLLSRSLKNLLNERSNGITNGFSTALQNVVCFPFDVWDKATGKYYAAGTTIVLGTDYDNLGNATKGTTFIVPSSVNTQNYVYATAAVAVNAPDIVLTQNKLFLRSANTLYRNELIASYFVSKINNVSSLLRPGESIDDKYIAYSTSTMKFNSTIANDRIIVYGEAIDDMYKNNLDYMYMGEMANFYLDTSGSFAGENCKVEITPHYFVNGQPIDMYYGFIYDAQFGLINPVVKVGEDQDALVKYVASPTDYERILRNELLGPTTAEENFWQVRTQSFIELNSMARFFRDVRGEVNPELESIVGKVGYRDSNADGVADKLQRSQARWYGQFNVQPDMMFVNQDMQIGYCSSCNDHHCSITGRCSVCGRVMIDVESFDLREYQDFLVYTDNHTDFLTKDGYLTVAFDIRIVDCDGNIIIRDDIPVYTDRGDLFTLTYKIGTKAGDKWDVSY